MLTYAIGDIHGMYKTMVRLLDMIKQDAGDIPYKLVFLGDYIDRGPDSNSVIQHLIDLKTSLGNDRVVTLMGNHEDMAIHDNTWIHNYGAATLSSYGSFQGSIPDNHMNFLKNLDLYHETKHNIFVHAGVDHENYDIYMANQSPLTLLWKRYQFGVSPSCSKVIVHGHTPHNNVEITENRINLDTGAVFKNKLSAAKFEDDSGKPVKILQVLANTEFPLQED